MDSIKRWIAYISVTTWLSVSQQASAGPQYISFSTSLPALHAGDVVLIALNCYICRVISDTTGSPYNHSSLVLDTDKGTETRVAQSLNATQELSLSDFLHQAKKTAPIKILRPRELANTYKNDPAAFETSSKMLNLFFAKKMRGLAFDDNYLWDNFDEDGRELLYCSEMIQKTLNHVLEQPLSTIALDYSRHWDFWQHYFENNVPQGEPGNSPASLANASQLITIFEGTVNLAQ